MRERLLIPVLGLGQIVAFASSYYLLGILADPMAADLRTQPATMFSALSIAFLLSALITPTAGRAIERFGGRRVQAFAHAAFATALLIMASAISPEMLWVGVALLGVGMGTGLYGTAFAIIVERRGSEARRGIAAVSLIGALGGGLGWPITRAITETGDWRSACLSWAFGHLLICLPVTLLALSQRQRDADNIARDGRITWDRPMVQLAALFAGAWFVSTAMGAHLPRVLVALGMKVSDAAWAAGLMAGCAVAARLIDLLWLHKSHPLVMVRLACLFHPIGASTALFGGVNFAPLLAVGQGLGNGLLSVASGVLPLKIFGPERYAVRQAMLLTPARYLQAAAPAVYAIALDHSAGLALTLSGGLCMMMLGLTLRLDRGKAAPS